MLLSKGEEVVERDCGPGGRCKSSVLCTSVGSLSE